MRTIIRSILAIVLLLGLSLPTFAGDAKSFDATTQAKIYRASLKAVDGGDWTAYSKTITSQAAREIEAQLKEMGKTTKDGMELMKMMAPSDMKVTDLKVDGKKATLTATGKSDGEAMYGTVELEEENGQWKVGKQSWTNTKP